ncbi:hypothetical protein Tco_1372267 [Tanacetum coccineum]
MLTESKRKQDDNQQQQQQQNKRQNTGKAYTAGLVRRNNMGDLNPYAQNATITMTVHVLPDAISAIKSAIWHVTARALQTPTMLTIRRALGPVRSLLVISVEPKGISRGIVQS